LLGVGKAATQGTQRTAEYAEKNPAFPAVLCDLCVAAFQPLISLWPQRKDEKP